MSKPYAAVMIGSLIGAIYFYNRDALYSLIFMVVFIFSLYSLNRL